MLPYWFDLVILEMIWCVTLLYIWTSFCCLSIVLLDVLWLCNLSLNFGLGKHVCSFSVCLHKIYICMYIQVTILSETIDWRWACVHVTVCKNSAGTFFYLQSPKFAFLLIMRALLIFNVKVDEGKWFRIIAHVYAQYGTFFNRFGLTSSLHD